MARSAATPIEHALIAGAFRIANGTAPDGVSVDPELDCLSQALHETCERFGMSSDDAARFMLSLARTVKRLQPDVQERLELRRVERQMHATLQEPRDQDGGSA